MIFIKQYKVAQLWSVAETSKNETGGGSGVEVLENKPCEEKLPDGSPASGYYTKKIYHTKELVFVNLSSHSFRCVECDC